MEKRIDAAQSAMADMCRCGMITPEEIAEWNRYTELMRSAGVPATKSVIVSAYADIYNEWLAESAD